MSGVRGSADENKKKIMVRVRLSRPQHRDRFFTSFIFVKVGSTDKEILRKITKKYATRFPNGKLYVVKVGSIAFGYSKFKIY
jgi:hypothetical protein